MTHIDELRTRLIRSVIAILAGMTGCLIFSDELIALILKTAGDPDEMKLTLLTPAEGVIVYLKVGLVAGIIVSSPVWLWQLWGFISPGLYSREKRVIIPVIGGSILAFVAGASFGFLLLPYTAKYFLSFSSPQVTAMWSLASYISLTLQFVLAFGVTFELPLVIFAAASLGLVTPAQLRKFRRHAIIGILILAAFITPGPDIFSQLMVAIPLLVLFEVGILAAHFAIKKPVETRAELK